MDGQTLLIIIAVVFLVRLVVVIPRERRERVVLAYMERLNPAMKTIDRWAQVAADVAAATRPATSVAARMELTEIKVKARSWDVPPNMTPVHDAFMEFVESLIFEWTVLTEESFDRTNEAARRFQLALQGDSEDGSRWQPGGFRSTILGAFFFGYPNHPYYKRYTQENDKSSRR